MALAQLLSIAIKGEEPDPTVFEAFDKYDQPNVNAAFIALKEVIARKPHSDSASCAISFESIQEVTTRLSGLDGKESSLFLEIMSNLFLGRMIDVGLMKNPDGSNDFANAASSVIKSVGPTSLSFSTFTQLAGVDPSDRKEYNAFLIMMPNDANDFDWAVFRLISTTRILDMICSLAVAPPTGNSTTLPCFPSMHPGMISALTWTLLNKNMGPLNAYDEDILSSCLMMLRNYGRPPSSKIHKLLNDGHFSPEPVAAEVLGGWVYGSAAALQPQFLCELICAIVQEDIRLGKFTLDLSSLVPVDLISFDPLTGLHPLEEKQVVTCADIITVLQTSHPEMCAKIITFVSKLVALGLVSEANTIEILALASVFGKRSEFYSFVDKSHVPLTKAEIDSKFDKLAGNALLEQLKDTFSKWREQRDTVGTSTMLSMLASAGDDYQQVLRTGITFTAPWGKEYILKRSHVKTILHKHLEDCYKFIPHMICDVEWKSEPANCLMSVLSQLCKMFPDKANDITRVIRFRVFCQRPDNNPNHHGHSIKVQPQPITFSPDSNVVARMKGNAKRAEAWRAQARSIYFALLTEARDEFSAGTESDGAFLKLFLKICDHTDIDPKYYTGGGAQAMLNILKNMHTTYTKSNPEKQELLLTYLKTTTKFTLKSLRSKDK